MRWSEMPALLTRAVRVEPAVVDAAVVLAVFRRRGVEHLDIVAAGIVPVRDPEVHVRDDFASRDVRDFAVGRGERREASGIVVEEFRRRVHVGRIGGARRIDRRIERQVRREVARAGAVRKRAIRSPPLD